MEIQPPQELEAIYRDIVTERVGDPEVSKKLKEVYQDTETFLEKHDIYKDATFEGDVNDKPSQTKFIPLQFGGENTSITLFRNLFGENKGIHVGLFMPEEKGYAYLIGNIYSMYRRTVARYEFFSFSDHKGGRIYTLQNLQTPIAILDFIKASLESPDFKEAVYRKD